MFVAQEWNTVRMELVVGMQWNGCQNGIMQELNDHTHSHVGMLS